MYRFLKNILDKIPCGVCSGLTVVLILWLTLAPQPVGEMDVPLFEGADKVVHTIMFGWLTWMLWIDTGKRTHRSPTVRATMLCALVAAAFGALIEVLQSAMHLGRSMEAADFIADFAGTLIAATALIFFSFHTKR